MDFGDLSRFAGVVVAAGSRDRSWLLRSLPTHSFASLPSRRSRAADAYLSCAISSLKGSLQSTERGRRPEPPHR